MNQSYHKPAVRVHSRLLDPGAERTVRGFNAVCMWYAVQAYEKGSCGYSEFSIKEMADNLSISEKTVRRHLTNGASKQLQFFRYCKVEGDRAVVYRIGLQKVLEHHDIQEFGAVGSATLSELKRSRVIATELELESGQRGATFQAKKVLKKRDKRFVLNTTLALVTTTRQQTPASTPDLGDRTSGPVMYAGLRCLFIASDWKTVGVSQETVARKSDRSVSTIRRRVSNRWRQSRGLNPIVKRQLVQHVPQFDGTVEPGIAADLIEQAPITVRDRLFVFRNRVWKWHCNIYATGRDLISMRASRHEYKSLLKQNKNRAPEFQDLILNTEINTCSSDLESIPELGSKE